MPTALGDYVLLNCMPRKLFFYVHKCICLCGLLILGLIFAGPVCAQDNNFYTVINPDNYIVGPGDGFRVDFWNGNNAPITFSVTAEGTVLLNSIGLINVDNLTLTQAKERLTLLIKKYYSDVDFSISLVGVRYVKIMVTGAVKNPGLYTASASARVSEVINNAGGFIKGASQRNIILAGANLESNVDLFRFERLGDFDSNPYIYSGSKIHVPLVTDSSSFIQISGEVVMPGGSEYKEGDDLGELVDLALGYTGLQGDSIYIFSGDESGKNQRVVPTSARNELIHPGDKIVVGRTDKGHLSNYFSITGEIVLPGRYPLSSKMTLADALSGCRGLTDESDIYSTVIYRLQEFNRTPDAKNILKNAFTNGVIFDDDREPVSIDFRDIYPDRLDQVPIMPGDSILIPVRTNVVAVYGLVRRPGLVSYTGPAGASKYIGMAGGFAPGADRQSIKIIRKTSGMQIIGVSGIDVYDGDTIVIPESRGKKSLWEKVKDGALVLGGLGILYLAIDNATD